MMLSIITINYNNAFDLERTIKSVSEQSWKEFEYIVIDGGSTDGSVEVLKKFSSDITYHVSEPDNGIYHAMNKGILKAAGEYLLMLNAGDVLLDKNILKKVFDENNFKEDIIYSDVFRESKGVIFTESIFPDRLNFMFLRNGAISHQAAFIRRKLHDIVGLYDEKMKLSSDWSFILLAVCKHNASYKHLPCKMAICNADGMTCSPAYAPTIEKEREIVLNTHFSAFIDDYKLFDSIRNRSIYHKANKFFTSIRNECKAVVKKILNRNLGNTTLKKVRTNKLSYKKII
jgi:glycosyltransferase involved in cell wall biosynthesis